MELSYEILKEMISTNQYYSSLNTYKYFHTINDLPIINKDDVINHYNSIVNTGLTRPWNRVKFKTSGSNGKILDVIWEDYDYYHSMSVLWKKRIRYNVHPNDKCLTCHVVYYLNGLCNNAKMILNKNFLSLSKLYVDNDTLSKYFSQINSFKPKWLYIQPSFLDILITFSDISNLQFPDTIEYVELVGENVTRPIYEKFKKTFKNVNILYGLQEFNGVAYGQFDNLEILNGNYVEIIDNNSNSLGTNKEGRIVITGLNNKMMPLIRYDTGDTGILYVENNINKIKITKSKANDTIRINNYDIDGSIFFNIISKINTKLDNPILQFNVDLKGNILTFVFVRANKKISFKTLEKAALEVIKECIGKTEYVIQIKEKECIPSVTQSNKIKYFINHNLHENR